MACAFKKFFKKIYHYFHTCKECTLITFIPQSLSAFHSHLVNEIKIEIFISLNIHSIKIEIWFNAAVA
jgi:hypothetical protein